MRWSKTSRALVLTMLFSTITAVLKHWMEPSNAFFSGVINGLIMIGPGEILRRAAYAGDGYVRWRIEELRRFGAAIVSVTAGLGLCAAASPKLPPFETTACILGSWVFWGISWALLSGEQDTSPSPAQKEGGL